MRQTVLGNIQSQPEVLRDTLNKQNLFIDPFVDIFKKQDIRRILFFGSGTSYNVSTIAAYYFKHIVGIDAVAQYPTIFKNHERADWTGMLKPEQILFVGISQSGTSISTCNVMQHAREMGYQTLALTGNLQSTITQHTDQSVLLTVGEELTPPETKGYTVSVLTVYLWAIATAKELGVYTKDQYESAFTAAANLIQNFQTVIEESETWYDRNRASLVNSEQIVILGYGIDTASTLEASLKIGEMLRLPVASYELEEYAHGPTMSLNSKRTLLMIGSDGAEYERMCGFRAAFRKYTPRVHVITCRELENADDRDLIFSYRTDKYLAPLMYTVPFQFLAAKGAKDIYIDTNINPFRESLGHYRKAPSSPQEIF